MKDHRIMQVARWATKAFVLSGVMLGSSLGFAQENLIPSGDFEKQVWRGGAWQGEGNVQLADESPFAGLGYLRVKGTGADARVQARSEAITVEPGARYTFECMYRLLKGKGMMSVRWGQAGVVFSSKSIGAGWESLGKALASDEAYAALYPNKLGAAEHEKLSSNTFTIPAGVTQVIVFIQTVGDSVLEVDNVSLTKAK